MAIAEPFTVDDSYNLLPSRLATFEKWPFVGSRDKCVPQALAEAGFIHRPDVSLDSVQCYVCQKILGGWNSNEDPMEEHKSHCPDCAFVQISAEAVSYYENLSRQAVVELECARFRNVFKALFCAQIKSQRDSVVDDLESLKKAAMEHHSQSGDSGQISIAAGSKRSTRRKRSAR